MGCCCSSNDGISTEKQRLLSPHKNLSYETSSSIAKTSQTRSDNNIDDHKDSQMIISIAKQFDLNSDNFKPFRITYLEIADQYIKCYCKYMDNIPKIILNTISNQLINKNVKSVILFDKNTKYGDIIQFNEDNKSLNIKSLDNKLYTFDAIYRNNGYKATFIDHITPLCDNFLNGTNGCCVFYGDNNEIPINLLRNVAKHCIINLESDCNLRLQIFGINQLKNEFYDYVEPLNDNVSKYEDVYTFFEKRLILEDSIIKDIIKSLDKNNELNSDNNITIYKFTFKQYMDELNVNCNILYSNECRIKYSELLFIEIKTMHNNVLINDKKNDTNPLFKKLKQKIIKQNKSSYIFQKIIDNISHNSNKNEFNDTCLTQIMNEYINGNGQMILIGSCNNYINNQKGCINTLNIASNAMKIINHPCMNFKLP